MAKNATKRPLSRNVERSQPHSHTFTLKAPAAKSVLLAGDFTGWQEHPISLRKVDNGCWQTSVLLSPGKHRYRFLVDGEWRDDPACRLRVANAFGTEDCVCQAG